MENFESVLFKCFYLLNFDFKTFLEEQNDRLIFQKYGLFLDEIFGLSIGRYSLYIHGPYNPSLASVGYRIATNLAFFRNHDNIVLKETAIQILHSLRNTFEPTITTEGTRVIETFSTFYYLLKKEHLDEDQAILKTIRIKGHLFEDGYNLEQEILRIRNSLRIQNTTEYNII